MRRRTQAGWVASGAILVGVLLVTIATASGPQTGTHRAKAADGGAGAFAQMSQASTGVKRTLLSFEGTVEPGLLDGAVGTCPKKYATPVSGWFSARSDKVVLASSIPIGKRKWQTAVINMDTVPSEYIVGVVCVK